MSNYINRSLYMVFFLKPDTAHMHTHTHTYTGLPGNQGPKGATGPMGQPGPPGAIKILDVSEGYYRFEDTPRSKRSVDGMIPKLDPGKERQLGK